MSHGCLVDPPQIRARVVLWVAASRVGWEDMVERVVVGALLGAGAVKAPVMEFPESGWVSN